MGINWKKQDFFLEKYNTKENSDVIFKEIYEATWWKFIHEIISLKWILVREKIKTFVKKNDMKNWIIKNIFKIIANVPTYVSYIGYWFFSPNLLPYLHVIFFTDVSLCSYPHRIYFLQGKKSISLSLYLFRIKTWTKKIREPS